MEEEGEEKRAEEEGAGRGTGEWTHTSNRFNQEEGTSIGLDSAVGFDERRDKKKKKKKKSSGGI